MGAAHVQQHRQFEIDGGLQLRLEHLLLLVAVQPFHVVVQADLAHRAEFRVAGQALQPGAQVGEVFLPVPRQVDRMQAQCGVEVRLGFHQMPDILPVLAEHPEQHLPFHPERAAALQHRLAVFGEVRAVQVVVGVDQAHRRFPQPARSLSTRGTAVTPGR
ncbi:hypothetical protein D9M68_325340 [compost metagenome]